MKKGLALIVMLAVALLMLSGCNLIGYDEELDGAQVVAKVNDTEITKAQWIEYRDYLAEYSQQYYQQYFGLNMELTEEDYAYYGESAIEQMIESVVIQDKIEELGLDVLTEEETAEAEEYVDSMYEFYRLMMRYQNYADIETVEEEAERIAAAAEATPDEAIEAVATVTDAELNAMIDSDLAEVGYTRDYLLESQKASVQSDKIYEYATKDVAVTDDEVKAEYDSRVAEQKTTFDATPTLYASYESNGTECYYIPEGYRGVKNLLIKISDEKSTEISTLESELTTAKNTVTSAQEQLDELNAADTSEYDEETLTAHNDQIAALNEQLTAAQATVTETETKIEETTAAAFAEIEETAAEVLAKAQAGEDFDALIEAYGEDSGMTSEPNKTRGYLVCEGLSIYEQTFQDAAMALASVGDVSSELVKTSYGYHILQYATDVAAGEMEMTDDVKTTIYDEMLTEAQDAAYEAAVTQWVSEASVTTYSKVME